MFYRGLTSGRIALGGFASALVFGTFAAIVALVKFDRNRLQNQAYRKAVLSRREKKKAKFYKAILDQIPDKDDKEATNAFLIERYSLAQQYLMEGDEFQAMIYLAQGLICTPDLSQEKQMIGYISSLIDPQYAKEVVNLKQDILNAAKLLKNEKILIEGD
ncbi:MAG: Mitochondrial import receptor subunit TOM20 [Paramarteilia canceri]